MGHGRVGVVVTRVRRVRARAVMALAVVLEAEVAREVLDGAKAVGAVRAAAVAGMKGPWARGSVSSPS
ncbi:hypothetical protein MYSTI_05348 [Myxococcus stipitatus DSM 14675]|uniref:Uncharacterized protein n=1 Tax=Myxococcus stipitatus (strain DSM 14675 / JCM 12634 / Mx s8) TaxID=1278073 RepID=L7UGB6_MYXSD|nr:hypothetical protein [Myxococcus stipitatus]AGC46627.1 hypothetical protein MYSTI_05348 [Myxococcus stipitatus DSM 14675]